ncbi:MAG: hypothetical protein Q9197_002233 [Variospora fuerteventurae]
MTASNAMRQKSVEIFYQIRVARKQEMNPLHDISGIDRSDLACFQDAHEASIDVGPVDKPSLHPVGEVNRIIENYLSISVYGRHILWCKSIQQLWLAQDPKYRLDAAFLNSHDSQPKDGDQSD